MSNIERESRRAFLRAGMAAAAIGLGGRAWGAAPLEISCILIWLQGGLSHLDSFDPKPDASADVRGPFGTIATRVPGVRLTDRLPRLATLMDRFAIVRSLDPGNGVHGVAEAEMMSGRKFDPATPRACFGSIVAKWHGESRGGPAFVQVGDAVDRRFGGGAGPLGVAFEPTVVPSSTLGAGCRLARRLVERGTRFVTVADGGWDCHADLETDLGGRLLPRLDAAVSALLLDLESLGLLASTLVAVLSDFGRAAALNRDGGRDHNPGVGLALLAGAGVPGGTVVGRTSADGGHVAEDRCTVADLGATILDRLGVPPSAVGVGGRPIRGLGGAIDLPGFGAIG